jgi:hypothetical protein
VGDKNARFLIIHNLSIGGFKGFGAGDGENDAERKGNWGSHGNEEESLKMCYFFPAWAPPYIDKGDIAIVQFVITTVDFSLDPLLLRSWQYTLRLL